MKILKLVEPNILYKEELIKFKEEFLINNETMHGGANLSSSDIDIWLDSVEKSKSEETVEEGLVPASILIMVDGKNNIIGIVNIRYRLNDFLLKVGGHIGYSIRKSERNKGYGTELLRLSILECKKLNLEKILVTCDDDNIGSRKVIENNKGIYENTIEFEGDRVERYWIEI